MAATALVRRDADSWRDAAIYMWVVSLVGLTLGVMASFSSESTSFVQILPWALAALAGDAFAVRLSGSVALSASLPVTLAAAFVLPVPSVALVGFLSVAQLPGTTWVQFGRNLFNRVEVAAAATCAAWVVRAFGDQSHEWPQILVVAVIALVADAATNAALMIPVVCIGEHQPVRRAFARFLGLRPALTLAAYGSAALAAPLLLVAWMAAGHWGLGAAMVCVALAGLALRSAQRLGAAENALSSTRALLQEGSEQVIKERREERRALAGELHDEVLPALYRVHLMGEVVKRDLEAGRLFDLEADVDGLLASTVAAQDATRGVAGSLLHSPLGVRGLGYTVTSLIEGLETEGTRIALDIDDEIVGDERSQTIAFQVVREGVTNAAKYSRATTITVRLRSESDALVVSVADDGCGFDVASTDAQVDHYGLALMKERVESIGGTLWIDTRLGGGTRILASLPSGS